MKLETLTEVITRLNWLYGRGDVVHVGVYSRKVKIKKQFGYETVPYRVKNRTVFFRGHRQTAKRGGVTT